MSLNVKICNIQSSRPYTVRYKSSISGTTSPFPEDDEVSYVLYGSGLTETTLTITGLTFNTLYWIKISDDLTGRYVIKNIWTHSSKAFPCFDILCTDQPIYNVLCT